MSSVAKTLGSRSVTNMSGNDDVQMSRAQVASLSSTMEAYLVDWLNLLVRWLHLITRHRVDRRVVLFRDARQLAVAAAKAADAKRGVFGELWAVHGGGFYDSQKFLTGPKGEPLSDQPALVEVGGLHDVAVGDGAARDHLLVRRVDVADRPQRARHRGGHGASRSASPSSSAAGSSTTACAGCSLAGSACSPPRLFAFVVAMCWVLFHVFSARAAYRARRRDARHDHGRERVLRDHSRTEGDGRRHPRRAGARSRAGHHRQAALGAQHVFHAAGAVRDDQQSLSDDLQPSVRLGWCLR